MVFQDPGDWLSPAEAPARTNPVTSLMARIGLYPSGGHLVKRVIGVAGDTITCCDAKGRIKVNGVALNQKSYARRTVPMLRPDDQHLQLDRRPGARRATSS